MSERDSYRIWIDPSGEVWIEDPDQGTIPLAQSLMPEFELPAPVEAGLGCRMPQVRCWPAPFDPDAPTEILWQIHAETLAAWRRTPELPNPTPPAQSLLDLKRAIVRRLFKSCILCEHRCGVNREAGERGVCKVGSTSYFAAGFVHLAEEREIAPSFCLTLTGCSWHCVYCHTYDLINRPDHGTLLEAPAYADLYACISAADVRTLSFVGGNPDHHLPAILDFLAAAPDDFARPIVWNSNMYGSPELYALLDGIVDVYLGDWRYGNDACARALSAIPTCVAPVARNWKLTAQQGARMIVRLLLLPGHLDCCLKPMIDWLAKELPDASISLLDQFHPTYLVAKRAPELDRRPSTEEVAQARKWLGEAGLREVA